MILIKLMNSFTLNVKLKLMNIYKKKIIKAFIIGTVTNGKTGARVNFAWQQFSAK